MTVSSKRACAVIAACVPFALAACGSSRHSNSSAASSSASSSAASSPAGSKTPVTVEMISQITAANFGSPETVPISKAVVAQINTQGGLGGHPIHLITCNDKGDPTTAGNCARTAAQSHAVAVVEGISLEGATIAPTLQAAKIPLITSPTVPDDYDNPISYPKDGGTLALWSGVGMLAARSGCKQIGELYDSSNPVGASGPPMVKAGVAAGGRGTVVANVGASESSVNLTPTIQSLLSKHVDCLATTLTPALEVGALKAIAQSPKPTIPVIADASALPLQVAQQVGSAAKHVLLDAFQYLPGDPRAVAFTSLAKRSGATDSQFAENAYVGFLMLQQALKGHSGALSAAGVITALNSSSALRVPVVPGTFDFTKPFPAKAYSRLSNLTMAGYSFTGKNFVALKGDRGLIDTAQAASAFAKGS